jgi:hypothetical protein
MEDFEIKLLSIDISDAQRELMANIGMQFPIYNLI